MKTATKWILGIVIGLIVLALVAAVVYVGFNWWSGARWTAEVRTGRLWDGGRMMPYRDMPWHQMPMQPYRGALANRVWLHTFPIRAIGGFLICLTLPALIALGIVALVLSQRRPRQNNVVPAPAVPVPEPTPAPAPENEEPASLSCSNCGKPVLQEWSHCPFCGNNLS